MTWVIIGALVWGLVTLWSIERKLDALNSRDSYDLLWDIDGRLDDIYAEVSRKTYGTWDCE